MSANQVYTDLWGLNKVEILFRASMGGHLNSFDQFSLFKRVRDARTRSSRDSESRRSKGLNRIIKSRGQLNDGVEF